MLAQFQSLYPTGSLTTELLQIHHGKYIVRSSVSIENVIRSTGMAAAETIEEAEDRSRTRALMVLVMTDEEPVRQKETKTSPKANLEVLPNRSLTSTFTAEKEHPTENVTSAEVSQASVSKTPSTNSSEVSRTSVSKTPSTDSLEVNQASVAKTSSADSAEVSQTTDLSTTSELFSVEDNNDIYSQEFEKPLPIPTYDEPELDIPEEDEDKDIVSDTQPEPEPEPEPTKAASASKSTTGRTTKKTTKTSTTKRKKKPEPIDLSDVIAKTDVQMERLGWTPQQGREYLIQTYNKRGRTLLTEEELLDFLQHLESIPTPHPELSEADPLAGF